MNANALDEIEGKLDDVKKCMAMVDRGPHTLGNLRTAIEQVAQCVRILRDAMKDAGTLRRIAERLETMEG